MSHPSLEIIGDSIKALHSTQELIERGEVQALANKIDISRNFQDKPVYGWLDNFRMNTIAAVHTLGQQAVSRCMIAGPLVFYVKEGSLSQSSGAVLLRPRHIEMHFSGDLNHLRDHRLYLGAMAEKIDRRRAKMPNYMIGVTHHDLASVAARLFDAQLDEIVDTGAAPSRYVNAVFSQADAARAVAGRRRLGDRSLYQFSLTTDKFVEKFLPK